MKIHYTAVVFHRVLRGPSVEKNIVDCCVGEIM